MAQQYKLESDVNDFVKDCFKRLKLENLKTITKSQRCYKFDYTWA